jgi:hypothetical protein
MSDITSNKKLKISYLVAIGIIAFCSFVAASVLIWKGAPRLGAIITGLFLVLFGLLLTFGFVNLLKRKLSHVKSPAKNHTQDKESITKE